MRISFVVARADLTGGARVIHTYAELLANRGHDVHVISRLPPRPTALRHAKSILLTGKSVSASNATHFKTGSYRLILTDPLRPISAQDVPDSDVVIATWWESAEWVWNMPVSKGRKVHFVQGYEVFDHTPTDRVHAALRKPMYKVTISRWLMTLLQREFGNQLVDLVPNGVDTQLFDAPRRGLRAVPTVGMIYNVLETKNCSAGISAYLLAKSSIRNLKLITVGTRPPSTARLGSQWTHFERPPQHRLKQAYASCDVWLWPSRSEGFGLPILEAMACRTPVLGTPAGAAPDLIADGENGYLVKSYDAASLAEALLAALELSEASWLAMSDSAYATAQRHRWSDATDLFEAALIRAAQAPEQIESRLS